MHLIYDNEKLTIRFLYSNNDNYFNYITTNLAITIDYNYSIIYDGYVWWNIIKFLNKEQFIFFKLRFG